MNEKGIDRFCELMREKHGAAECRSFSGRVESYVALFDAIELRQRDCVYVSALCPSCIVKLILAYGALPVFCDISADSFTIDHRSLENAVRQTISVDQIYPRAVIAEHVCGMPFPVRAINDICERMGLILIEDCGFGYGGSWENTPVGSAGDYSLISLGSSSVFGTGGSGTLLLCSKDFELSALQSICDGEGYGEADSAYAEALEASFGRISASLEAASAALRDITAIMKNSDFWLQRGGGRQKSACSGTVVIAQDETQCEAAIASLEAAGLGCFARRLHSHHKSCFEHGCRGFKTLDNATALAPRSFAVDINGAVNAGRLEELKAHMQYISDNIHA